MKVSNQESPDLEEAFDKVVNERFLRRINHRVAKTVIHESDDEFLCESLHKVGGVVKE